MIFRTDLPIELFIPHQFARSSSSLHLFVSILSFWTICQSNWTFLVLHECKRERGRKTRDRKNSRKISDKISFLPTFFFLLSSLSPTEISGHIYLPAQLGKSEFEIFWNLGIFSFQKKQENQYFGVEKEKKPYETLVASNDQHQYQWAEQPSIYEFNSDYRMSASLYRSPSAALLKSPSASAFGAPFGSMSVADLGSLTRLEAWPIFFVFYNQKLGAFGNFNIFKHELNWT